VSPLPIATPALPLHTAGPYVAAAYVVFVVLVLVYVAIMAIRLGHTRRELEELKQEVEGAPAVQEAEPSDRVSEAV
jgi:flagellar biosynthesis/type III secretory pathway M-ring protein FliF/YscJ